MPSKKALLFFNPNSGYGRKKSFFSSNKYHDETYQKLLSEILSELSAHSVEATPIILDKDTDIKNIINNSMRSNVDIVIAAGGDGTINAVINGLIPLDIPLGIIPIGSVNILALELAIPKSIKDACFVIANGISTHIDIGKAGPYYFSSMTGIGLDAQVIKNTPISLKKKYGIYSYIFIGLKQLLFKNKSKISIQIKNNPTHYSGYWVLVMNSRYYGGPFTPVPNGSITDGTFDVIILKKKTPLILIKFIVHLIKGTISLMKEITIIKATQLTIQNSNSPLIHIDAEIIDTPINDIYIIPKGITIKTPLNK